MSTYLDPYSTDFGNDVEDLAADIEDLLKGRGTQYIIDGDDQFEGYVIDIVQELSDYDFPDDEGDREQIASGIAESLDTSVRQRAEAYHQMKNPGDDDYEEDADSDESSDSSEPKVWFDGDYINIVF